MSRRIQENIILCFILLILVATIVACLDYGPRARLVPIPIASLGIILAIAQLVWQNLRPADELQVDVLEFLTSRSADKSDDKPKRSEEDESPWGREAIAVGFVALLTGLILLIGPIPSIFLFSAGYMIVRRQYTWPMGIAVAAVFTAIVYLLFAVLLGVQVDRSILGPMLDF